MCCMRSSGLPLKLTGEIMRIGILFPVAILFGLLLAHCEVKAQQPKSNPGKVTTKPTGIEVSNPLDSKEHRAASFANSLISNLDKNKNGVIDLEEYNEPEQRSTFRAIDENADKQITHEEIRSYYIARHADSDATAAAIAAKVPRKLIHFEFVLIERAAADLAAEKHKTPTVEQLLQLEKDGKAAHVQRLKLSALENVEARLQLGEDAPFVSGRSSRGGGVGGFGGVQESITYNSLGTTITLTAEAEADGKVLATLNLARSTVAPAKPAEKVEGQESPAASYPRRLQGTLATTVRIKPGEATLIGGQQTPTGNSAGDLWVIVTAKVD